jgi:hypothetical protein
MPVKIKFKLLRLTIAKALRVRYHPEEGMQVISFNINELLTERRDNLAHHSA